MKKLVILDPLIYTNVEGSEIVFMDCATGLLKTWNIINNASLLELSSTRICEIGFPYPDEIDFLIDNGWAIALELGSEPFVQNLRLVTKRDYEHTANLFNDDVSRYFNRVEINLLGNSSVSSQHQHSLKLFLSQFGDSLSSIVVKVNDNNVLKNIEDKLPNEKTKIFIQFNSLGNFDTRLLEKFKKRLILSDSDTIGLSSTDILAKFDEVEGQFESEDGLSRLMELFKTYSELIPTPKINNNIEFLKRVLSFTPTLTLGRKCHPKDIIRNSIINQLSFGLLYYTDGMISAEENNNFINYSQENIFKIIREQLQPHSQWRTVRRMFAPCKSCVYQELCPPIQPMEVANNDFLIHVFCDSAN
jgi:hypothetical protein